VHRRAACRHGHTSAAPPDPGQPGNAHVREDRALAQLPALCLLLASAGTAEARRRHRTRRGTDARPAASPEEAAGYLRANEIALTYDQATGTLRARPTGAAKTTTGKAS
jgi:site-specific DNA recombinase